MYEYEKVNADELQPKQSLRMHLEYRGLPAVAEGQVERIVDIGRGKRLIQVNLYSVGGRFIRTAFLSSSATVDIRKRTSRFERLLGLKAQMTGAM